MMEYSGLGEGEEMFSGDRNIRGRAARIADIVRLETFVKNVREDFPGMMKKGSMEKLFVALHLTQTTYNSLEKYVNRGKNARVPFTVSQAKRLHQKIGKGITTIHFVNILLEKYQEGGDSLYLKKEGPYQGAGIDLRQMQGFGQMDAPGPGLARESIKKELLESENRETRMASTRTGSTAPLVSTASPASAASSTPTAPLAPTAPRASTASSTPTAPPAATAPPASTSPLAAAASAASAASSTPTAPPPLPLPASTASLAPAAPPAPTGSRARAPRMTKERIKEVLEKDKRKENERNAKNGKGRQELKLKQQEWEKRRAARRVQWRAMDVALQQEGKQCGGCETIIVDGTEWECNKCMKTYHEYCNRALDGESRPVVGPKCLPCYEKEVEENRGGEEEDKEEKDENKRKREREVKENEKKTNKNGMESEGENVREEDAPPAKRKHRMIVSACASPDCGEKIQGAAKMKKHVEENHVKIVENRTYPIKQNAVSIGGKENPNKTGRFTVSEIHPGILSGRLLSGSYKGSPKEAEFRSSDILVGIPCKMCHHNLTNTKKLSKHIQRYHSKM